MEEFARVQEDVRRRRREIARDEREVRRSHTDLNPRAGFIRVGEMEH
jgi:hypothetical protein